MAGEAVMMGQRGNSAKWDDGGAVVMMRGAGIIGVSSNGTSE
jgi:hypothetical protein